MKFITKTDLSAWIDAQITNCEVVAPIEHNGHYLYEPIQSSREIDWSFTRPILPVKEYFFNPTEQILTFTKQWGNVTIHETLQEDQRIIIGVRPCDAHGLKVLDAMFLDADPLDPNYKAHRDRTLLVGFACIETLPTCFCTSLGEGPDSTDGLDLLITPINDGFIVEPVTARGEGLAASMGWVDREIEKPAPPEMPIIPFPEQGAWEALFHLPIWEQTAERCLSCRICAYVCPTCRCFDIRDELIAAKDGKQEFERIRVWDSCASEAYRKIAGGHNPRKAKAERLRNRFYCKFDYFPSQYGPLACTGCGRCIELCPVNIDICETLNQLAEVVT
ncbi:MAG: 4Fe-4S dicluster domain-containing protein [Anaerolineales bacterium]|nr:4Fe-4S dicluster domain-containing protein [Anaerolineales bacterium]